MRFGEPFWAKESEQESVHGVRRSLPFQSVSVVAESGAGQQDKHTDDLHISEGNTARRTFRFGRKRCTVSHRICGRSQRRARQYSQRLSHDRTLFCHSGRGCFRLNGTPNAFDQNALCTGYADDCRTRRQIAGISNGIGICFFEGIRFCLRGVRNACSGKQQADRQQGRACSLDSHLCLLTDSLHEPCSGSARNSFQ